MSILEKIVLTLVDYILIAIFAILAMMAYLMMNNKVALVGFMIVFILVYVLGLIEEL